MKRDNEVEMVVAGLVLDPSSNAPIVILKDPSNDVCLPIWIGLAEATAIATAMKKVSIARPMTHDLLKILVEEFGGNVVRIVIHSLSDNTFLANIEIAAGESLRVVDARPSDAIALAVRVDAPIFVTSDVLSQAQVTLVAVPTEEAAAFTEEHEVKDVPEQNFANIEKDKWADILADMDPDDFKYKM